MTLGYYWEEAWRPPSLTRGFTSRWFTRSPARRCNALSVLLADVLASEGQSARRNPLQCREEHRVASIFFLMPCAKQMRFIVPKPMEFYSGTLAPAAPTPAAIFL